MDRTLQAREGASLALRPVGEGEININIKFPMFRQCWLCISPHSKSFSPIYEEEGLALIHHDENTSYTLKQCDSLAFASELGD